MDHPLRTISYIADIGNMVVLMARRTLIRSPSGQEHLDTADAQHTDERVQYRMICHVFESEDVSPHSVLLLVLIYALLKFVLYPPPPYYDVHFRLVIIFVHFLFMH